MIELTNIKATDTVGQLRGQINTMQNEIMADQPMIGACVDPSIYLYHKDSLEYAFESKIDPNYTNVTNYLNAVILPNTKGNKCFVVGFTGLLQFLIPPNEAAKVDNIRIRIPSISGITAANTSYSYSKFITPDSLGLNHNVNYDRYLSYTNCQYMHRTTGSTVKVAPCTASITTSSITTNLLEIKLNFDTGSHTGDLDFNNGATGYISF